MHNLFKAKLYFLAAEFMAGEYACWTAKMSLAQKWHNLNAWYVC